VRIARRIEGTGAKSVSDHAFWIDFFRPEDRTGYTRYGTRLSKVAVASSDGVVELRDWHDVTYQELLVSSELGLIDGDVTRPYIHLTVPQGDIGPIIEAGQATAEAIRAAYDAFPVVVHVADRGIRVVKASAAPWRHIVDDAMRLWFLREVFLRGRHRLRARRMSRSQR
jgi:hypothetical protein